MGKKTAKVSADDGSSRVTGKIAARKGTRAAIFLDNLQLMGKSLHFL